MKLKMLIMGGHVDDIFLVNIAKWLKKEMNVDIDIIALNESKSKQIDSQGLFSKIDILPQRYLFDTIPYIRRYTKDWSKCIQLKKMLKGRHYDVIHCHYIAGMYAGASFLKDYCDRLYFTFWGGEYDKCQYFGSNELYKSKLKKIINKEVDALVNGSIDTAIRWKYEGKTPKYYHGSFGSSSLDCLYDLIDKTSKEESKKYLDMPIDKKTVQICYSGKSIHQQTDIIFELEKHEELKEQIHLVAPMTRGADKVYTDTVEMALKKSGFTYTLLRDRFLTDSELARLRHSVDVVLQLSTYDGYSRSVVECLCAGSVVIYGNWLNYQIKFKDDGFEGVGVNSIEEAVDRLCEYVKMPSLYNQMISNNIEGGKGKYLWSECIKEWVAVYKGTAQSMES